MIKSNIRYIVKKVIIGILITLGVLFLKPLLASAEELDEQIDYTICLTSRGYDILDVAKGTTCGFSSPSIADSKFTKFYSFKFPNTSIVFNFKNETTLANNYINFYDKENDAYMIIQLKSSSITNYNMILNEKANEGSSVSSDIYDKFKENVLKTYTDNENYNNFRPIIISKNKNSVYEKYYNSINNNSSKMYHRFERKINDETYYFYLSNGYSANVMTYGLNYNTTLKMYERVLPLNFDKFQLLEKSFEKIYINNIEKDFEPTLPTNYKKIDMFNKYAVLFYPKDFRNVPTECTKSSNVVTTDADGNVTVIPNGKCDETSYKFNFYYAGYFNTAFANLKDMSIVSDPVEQLPFSSTSTPYELPLYKNVDDFKGGILFYNDYKSQITDANGNVTVYYDKGYIYYDSSLFNYVIIEDYDTTPNQNISWVDKDGNTQNATINNIPNKNQTTLNKAQDTFDLFKNFKTNDHGLSSIITAPLQAIKNLTSSTCNSLDLPIPFSKGQTISLPCMTSIYENRLGIIYTMYKTIITGYIGYWVCVRIYTLIKGFKDPDDDKVEVLDL